LWLSPISTLILISIEVVDRPGHRLSAIVVDASNVIMELQAASIVISRSVKSLRQDFRMSQRSYMMRQVARTVRVLEGTAIEGEFSTIAVICSDLLGSMAQIAETRTAGVGKEVTRRKSQQSTPQVPGPPRVEVDDLFQLLNEPYEPMADATFDGMWEDWTGSM
jgi:hypothetical protein